MTVDAARQRLVELALSLDFTADDVRVLASLATPSVVLGGRRCDGAADRHVLRSRIGGEPDLPQGMAWPSDVEGAFGFVGQIFLHLALPILPHLDPSAMVSVFSEQDAVSENPHLVLCVDSSMPLVRHRRPKRMRDPDIEEYPGIDIIDSRIVFTLPFDSEKFADDERYSILRQQLTQGAWPPDVFTVARMFGHADEETGGSPSHLVSFYSYSFGPDFLPFNFWGNGTMVVTYGGRWVAPQHVLRDTHVSILTL